MEAVECFLLRSGCSFESSVNSSDVSIRRTFTPPRTMRCSFLLRLFIASVVAAIVSRLFHAEFVAVAVLEAAGVAIHGVDWCSSRDNQMRYAILWRVCQRSTTSWEYESRRSLVLLLRRANVTSLKIPQSLFFPCSGELVDWSEQARLHSLSVS